MRQRPSRLRRLDGALGDLPLDEPMLLTELDGFLTGVLLCPDAVGPIEWMRNVWGADEGDVPVFDDPADVQWFADAVLARQQEIARDLDRGKFRPIFDVDERNGDIIWELWADGFAEAMELRPNAWAAVADGADPAVADALADLTMLIAIARDQSDLDSLQINAMQDRAPGELVDCIVRLYAAGIRYGVDAAPVAGVASMAKAGRNDACPCGSGRKFKRCCAAA